MLINKLNVGQNILSLKEENNSLMACTEKAEGACKIEQITNNSIELLLA